MNEEHGILKISEVANSVTPSLTRRLYNRALEIGDDVINLTLGDPDIVPPEEIRKAACTAIMDGKTRYSANAGLIAVRESYASFFNKEYNMSINAADNVIATVGGMEALYLSLLSLVDRGDEVIVLGPYYVNYFQMISMCGGTSVVINRLEKSCEQLLSEIDAAVTGRTVGIIVNTPCNPVGDILPKSIIEGIAALCVKHNLFCISDEVYGSLVYDDKVKYSIIHEPGMEDRTIIIDSCSKRFAMTGWRVGFAVAPKELIANMTKLQENIAACAPLPSQYAAIKAYSGEINYQYIQEIYQHRRDLVYEALCAIPKLRPIYPEATFYCFVNISATGLKAEEFAYQLLESYHVAVVPGNAYGEEYADFIRIAFTLNDDLLLKAMERIKGFTI